MLIKKMIGSVAKGFATYRDSDGWFHDWMLQGRDTASGELVSPSTAMTLSSYFAAIRNISEDIAKLPLPLFRRLPNGDKERAINHPLYRVLTQRPNSEMCPIAFRETMTEHALGWGNGLAEIVMDGRGVVEELLLLDPSRTTITRDERGLKYTTTQEDGSQRVLRSGRVFPLHGLGFDGVTGYSIAHLARQSIGLGMATEKFGATFFGRGTHMGGVLEHPGFPALEKRTEMLKTLRAGHEGAINSHKPFVAWGGMKWSPTTVPPDDAQFIESRKFTVTEMARWVRIPPHKIMDLEHGTFSNIAEQNIEYVTDTLMAWAVRWEQAIKRWLISPFRPDLFAEHVFAALLRGDTEARFRAYAIARQWGWESANTILRMENRNGIGPKGDVYYAPSNMIPAEEFLPEFRNKPEPEPSLLPEDDDEPETDDEGDEADGDDEEDEEELSASLKLLIAEQVKNALHDTGSGNVVATIDKIAGVFMPIVADSYRRILNAEVGKLRRHRKANEFENWSRDFYKQHRSYVRGALIPVVDVFCHQAWAFLKDGDMPEHIEEAVGLFTAEMSGRHIADSLESLRHCNNGDFEVLMTTWETERPQAGAEDGVQRLAAFMRKVCG